MRKRILTVAALAAALATSLVIGSTTVGAQDLSKVDVFKTNDADGDGIFTDDEVVDPAAAAGEIEYRITIVNGSDKNVTIPDITDDILPLSATCLALISPEPTVLNPGNNVGCILFGDPPTAVQVNTVSVKVKVADNGTPEFKFDSTIVRPATIQLFNARINVAGTLVKGKVENLTLMVTDTIGPIAILSPTVTAKVTGTVEEPTVLLEAGVNVQLTEPAKPGSTFTSWTMEGTTVEGATGTQLDLDIREFTVKLKVKPGKEKESAEMREAKVGFGVLFAPDAFDKFSADLDLSGEIHVQP